MRASRAGGYPEIVDRLPVIRHGAALAPTDPGLGAALLPHVRQTEGAVIRESSLSR